MNPKENKLKFYFATIILAILVISIFQSCKESKNEEIKEIKPTKVDIHIVSFEKFSSKIKITGELLPTEVVELKSPLSGTVMKIYFTEGQIVKKGEILVEIDHRAYKAKKKGLESQLKVAESNLQRKKELIGLGGVSAEELEKTNSEVIQLQSEIEELNILIDLSIIKAPFNGQVGMRNFSEGTFMAQGTTITKIYQNDRLKLDLNIPAKYAASIKKNQQIKVYSKILSDSLSAEIYAIEPGINPKNRSLKVRAMIENNEKKLYSGDFVEAIIPINYSEKAMLIPSQALISELNAHVVYILKDGISKKQIVEIGNRTSKKIQILSGVSVGDSVIITGLMKISDGQKFNANKFVKETAE